MGVHSLIPHPAAPPRGVTAIDVSVAIDAGRAVLTYRVTGDTLMVPPRVASRRTDDLWKHSCFELFVRPEGGAGYFEFNFSPSTEWAAYRFDGYRAGMADFPLASPQVDPLENGLRVTVDLSTLPPLAWHIGLSAVIEETDGTKSYWAIAHPPEKPDFHDGACFALQLPAARAT